MGIIRSWLEKARLEAGHFSCRDMNRGPFTTDRAVTIGKLTTPPKSTFSN